MKRKTVVFDLLFLLLLMVPIVACNGTVSDDDIQTAIAQTQQSQIASESEVDITQPAADTEEPAAETAPTETAPETAAPEQTDEAEEPTFPAANAEYEGINFYLDNQLFSGWEAEIVPASDPASDNPFQTPSFYHIRFLGLPESEYAFTIQTPAIYVIPVQNMQTFPGGGWGLAMLSQLQEILATEPATTRPGVLPITRAPSFPVLNTTSNIQYLDFQSGSGVRYLASYSQGPNVAHPNYHFLGLTDDGQYYISAVFPVDSQSLRKFNAPYIAILEDDPAVFMQDVEAYFREVEALLNASANDSFNPDLSVLDRIVQSIVISR